MKNIKLVYAQFLLLAFLCIGCSQHRLVTSNEFWPETKQLQSDNGLSLADSSENKSRHIEQASMKMRADSLRIVAVKNTRTVERHTPSASQTKLIPFREKASIFWTCAGVGALSGMVIGLMIGSANKPDYPSDESGWAGFAAMLYGTAIGGATGAVVGVIVTAGDGVLLLGDTAPERYPDN